MSEQSSQEPTMEEILASIRRIISEDDAPAAEPAAAAPVEEPPAPAAAAPEPEPETPVPPPAPQPVMGAPEEDEDALELTEKVETHGDLDVYTPGSPEPDFGFAAPPPVEPIMPLVSDRAAEAAASAFGQLSAAVLMPAEGRTLEDVVRELLRPLLQQWLDDNLPAIVQQAVTAEVERIARGRVR
ncbi:DUF2497 domain-containing protein [Phenylobacterium deserti]|uniref:DUF2497 domain-containing protein n=1 Tax=Phenylobacterium deserti TaxID=1914756 RepID=A0A328ADL9_9CAUL|nr:DUF2497 domain-containing protein [Phenylobacterium deserti]RAK52316.1 DUF2497 domain-containing protein [Phenylobacterium deserti]